MGNMKVILGISVYLLAIIVANGLITYFGQIAIPATSFVLISCDMATRDILHEKWRDGFLFSKMTLLILCGSALSYLSSAASAEVTYASTVAFGCSSMVDMATYSLLNKHQKIVKMNGSNLVSGIVDSILFPYLAFGMVIPWLSATQVLAKFSGGFIWTAIFLYLTSRSKKL